jgi:hypothetical protein
MNTPPKFAAGWFIEGYAMKTTLKKALFDTNPIDTTPVVISILPRYGGNPKMPPVNPGKEDMKNRAMTY